MAFALRDDQQQQHRHYNEELDSSSGCDMSFECSSDNIQVTTPPSTINLDPLQRRSNCSPSPTSSFNNNNNNNNKESNMYHDGFDSNQSPNNNNVVPQIFLSTPKNLLPRRLDLSPKKKASITKRYTLNPSPEMDKNEDFKQNHLILSAAKNQSLSPPYKRVKALRLFNSPLTPKTILAKSANASLPRLCLFQNNNNDRKVEKQIAVPTSYEKPAANVNPFVTNMLLSKKRTVSVRSPISSPEASVTKLSLNDCYDMDDMEIERPTKRIGIQESNISRYNKEFHEICLIGRGQYGSVYKCINRLDGLTYAIKKSIQPVAGSFMEKRALNEVYAHAVLGIHQHVVRYYSAWAENNRMIIQNEFCNGGSLADKIEHETLSLSDLRRLTIHIAEGLRYIHSVELVHLDIKPGNIFISKEIPTHYTNYDSAEDDFCTAQEQHSIEEDITYKIGDLGHVTTINNPQVEEGDCRYLAPEILREDYSHLTKADVFALGLTIIEAAGSGPLPKNGPEWLRIREGQVPEMKEKLSEDFSELLKSMIHPDPVQRPTPLQVLQHKALIPAGRKTNAELYRELNAERLKNEILSKQLSEVAKCFKSFTPEPTAQLKVTRHSSRLIGKKYARSFSATNF